MNERLRVAVFDVSSRRLQLPDGDVEVMEEAQGLEPKVRQLLSA